MRRNDLLNYFGFGPADKQASLISMCLRVVINILGKAYKNIAISCFCVCYRPQTFAKVMFLHLSVILFTGRCLPQCMLGYTHNPLPPGADTPRSRHPRGQTTPGSRHHPPRSRHLPLLIIFKLITENEIDAGSLYQVLYQSCVLTTRALLFYYG